MRRFCPQAPTSQPSTAPGYRSRSTGARAAAERALGTSDLARHHGDGGEIELSCGEHGRWAAECGQILSALPWVASQYPAPRARRSAQARRLVCQILANEVPWQVSPAQTGLEKITLGAQIMDLPLTPAGNCLLGPFCSALVVRGQATTKVLQRRGGVRRTSRLRARQPREDRQRVARLCRRGTRSGRRCSGMLRQVAPAPAGTSLRSSRSCRIAGSS